MYAAEAPQTFWVFKRGQLVLIFRAEGGVFLPTRGPLAPEADPEGLMAECEYASGQFLSVEWEPRVREVLKRLCAEGVITLNTDKTYSLDPAARQMLD